VDHLLNFPSEDGRPSLSTTNQSFPTLRSRYPRYAPTGTRVHALDLRCVRNTFPNCTYHEADITSAEALLEVFRKVQPDVVINTASPHFHGPRDILKKVNVEGTQTLLEVAGGTRGDWGGRCRAFVHTSSSSVVHDTVSDLINADERYPYVCPNPREYYSETKVYAEKAVLAANDKVEFGNMLTCAVRPAGIVGEGDMAGFSGSILQTAKAAPSWQLHIQLGPGDNLFDNTYVYNVAHGLLCATDALLKTDQRRQEGKAVVLDHEKVDGEAFNVTNDQPIYFWDSAHFLESRYGRDIDTDKIWALSTGFATLAGGGAEIFNWLAGRKARFTRQTVKYSCAHRYFSCDKLKRRCGYQPIVGIEEAFLRAVQWFKETEEQQKRAGGSSP